MTDKSKTKKRKGAEKERKKSLRIERPAVRNEGEPNVKRRKMAKVEGWKKVIEIGSSSNPTKKIKRKRRIKIVKHTQPGIGDLKHE